MTYSRHLDDERPIGLRSKLAGAARHYAHKIGLVDSRRAIFEQSPVDLRGLGLRPDEALRRAGSARFVIDMPIGLCRGLMIEAFPLSKGAGHPHVETARLLKASPSISYAETPLRRYYETYRPRTAAERLGVDLSPTSAEKPPEIAIFPWLPARGSAHLANRRANLRTENSAHGAAIDYRHGFLEFGPVSDSKGALEVKRMRQLLDAITENGFRLFPGRNGLCRGHILVSGESYRCVLAIGQHRAAAFAALGGEALPVWPHPELVRREEVLLWPGVRAGDYSPEAALAVFDRVFAGEQPPLLAAWATEFAHRSDGRRATLKGPIDPTPRSAHAARPARLDRSGSST